MGSRKPYRGVNIWLLGMAAEDAGYASPWWGSRKRIAALGGEVKAGERDKATIVVFWKRLAVRDDEADDGTKVIPLLRYYRVYNAEQCTGLPERFYPAPREPGQAPEVITPAETIVKQYLAGDGAPGFTERFSDRAYYRPGTDEITVPQRGQYESAGEYYSTVFHEMAHSTGHPSRLDRKGMNDWAPGAHPYGKEELCAEMANAMLQGVAGIDTEAVFTNSAAYIGSWLRQIREDNRLVVKAAAQAQKAADLILGVTWDDGEGE
jgi:antirestriction protein ArdC